MQRKTKQREAIQQVFSECNRPLRAEEVHLYAHKKVASLGIATVYRNLRKLVENGELEEISIPEVGTLYERSGKGHRHYFYCRICNKLMDLSGCPVKGRRLAPQGYKVERHEVFLYGVCEPCANSGKLTG